ncbi:Crp/Fnr family transcriptional regulator [Aureispira anguillae]|uniref:Crp/Fnr family transcriptional regulator n=1 Tax=Aureispira anguillae TaxID=2864201 RepID=A0A915YKT5_9BACT|nr:Crp/Fnr family transcriptional regulator [Aureispira anguillae]BDS15062.1 Crp/Fnr family transcriptional regulator [Aureispira anguillae]
MINFVEFCHTISPLNSEEKEELAAILTHTQKQKGASILRSNAYCKDLFFITKGVAKLGFQNNGKEFIMRFFEEGILFTELESLIKRQPSKYEVTALEAVELTIIPFYKFEALCHKHHKLETFFRKFLSLAHLNMMGRISEILEEDAKTRYLNFLNSNPGLMQRISLGDLANYLGITQVSLSRIRAEI